ncbi:thymidine phosphorylase [Mesoplasma corruscae]|uniref:Thymidine phosphorylase n=1 Tax=Mesoplasma corruscae TaxID=216874 RepID=A0A2S5RGX2_9MOLU|nr:thymidine phosphorylase [Mesoplasma corruscae]PPE06553.1 thymidine phosphorylase [Mesoplasma corruscae]
MGYTFNNLIEKKKHKQELSTQEIKWLIDSFVKNDIKDYQMSAMGMAIWFNGMSDKEIVDLTRSYVESGFVYDVSEIKGLKADKHSTGGVGDKTSLVLSPILASYGVNVCKMSGRGLGVTGGTIDKLESCPGWTSELNKDEFIQVIKKSHIGLVGQSDDIVPADKKMYALRDVTGTVDSIPLIAASIMSKKLTIEADSLVLDVKVGTGAFMKNIAEAEKLAKTMISIGEGYGRKVSVILSNMDKPLGKAIGNALEVKEAYDALLGKGPEDLIDVVTTAAGVTLVNVGLFTDIKEAILDVKNKLKTGEAAKYLKCFIEAQHGDFSVIENYDNHFTTKHKIEILASRDGYVDSQDAEIIGLISMDLGAGRKTKEDTIDFAAGIYLNKKDGEQVKRGDLVMTLYTNFDIQDSWIKRAENSFKIIDQPSSILNIYRIMR